MEMSELLWLGRNIFMPDTDTQSIPIRTNSSSDSLAPVNKCSEADNEQGLVAHKAATVRDLKRDSCVGKDLVPNRQRRPNVRSATIMQTDLTYMVVYLSILQLVTAFFV